MRPPLPLLRALADVLDLGAEAAAAVGLLVVSAVGALPAGPVDVGTRHAAAAVAHRRVTAGAAGGASTGGGPGAARIGSPAPAGPVALHPAS